MSRKEFLQLLMVAIISMLGINNFIASLLRNRTSSTTNTSGKSPQSHGFGSRTFGS